MSTTFTNFVQKVVNQIDGNKAEKEDIFEELIIHLQLSSEHFKEAGYDKKEAEKMAMNNFGETSDIGEQMQQAMFPFRKKMFLGLAIISLLYSFVAYLLQLFVEGDAHIGWLIISVVTSSILLLFALQAFPSLDRKVWLNSALILHSLVFLYGSFLASGLSSPFSISLTIVVWFIILFSIFLVYRTTIYDYQYKQSKTTKHMKFLHGFNITIGIVATGITLFLLWATLLFAEFFEVWLLQFLTPLFVWIIAYVLQLFLMKRNKKKSAYFVTAILILFFLCMIILFFAPMGGIL